MAGWLTACDTTDDQRPRQQESSTAAKPSQCRTVLGAAGVNWVEKNSDSKIVESDFNVRPLGNVEREFPSDARNWSPETDKDSRSLFVPSVCRLTPAGMEDGERAVWVRLGTASDAFDEVDQEDLDRSEVTDVSGDVRLVSWERNGKGSAGFSVFVKCRISRALDGQENRVPIEALITDNLTRDADNKKEHFTLLLHAARYFVDRLDCLNGPKVPVEMPTA